MTPMMVQFGASTNHPADSGIIRAVIWKMPKEDEAYIVDIFEGTKIQVLKLVNQTLKASL